MSKILKRPMFRRGGKVDSRGTGITSGLGYATGGRVGYAGAGFVTGAELLRLAEEKGGMSEVSKLGQINPKSLYLNQAPIGAGFNFLTSPTIAKPNIQLASTDTTSIGTEGEEDPLLSILNEEIKRKKRIQELTGNAPIYDETETEGGAIDVSEFMKKVDTSTSGAGGATTGGATTGGATTGGTKTTGEDNTITLSDIEQYKKDLGIEKARSRDIGDMLARFSASALKRPARGEERGFTDVLSDFMAGEAKIPSRTEKIEESAALLGIKQKQAEKLAKIKAKEGYAPGALSKNAATILASGVTTDPKEAVLIAAKLPRNFPDAYMQAINKKGVVTDMEFDILARAQGISPFPNMPFEQIPDGSYFVPGQKQIIYFKNKKIVDKTSFSSKK